MAQKNAFVEKMIENCDNYHNSILQTSKLLQDTSEKFEKIKNDFENELKRLEKILDQNLGARESLLNTMVDVGVFETRDEYFKRFETGDENAVTETNESDIEKSSEEKQDIDANAENVKEEKQQDKLKVHSRRKNKVVEKEKIEL